MAVLSSQHVSDTLGAVSGVPTLTVAHDSFAVVSVPYETEASLSPGQGSRQPHLPVASTSRIRSGQIQRHFVADLYGRVHISPSWAQLGNVVSEQVFPVDVWNAHFESRELGDITGLEEGVSLSNQPVPPLSFPPLEERTWLVSVSQQGATVLDANLVWQFANGEKPALHITATRIIGWPWSPNWAQPVVERLAWLTDVLRSESNVEQRRALRTAPRRTFSAQVMVQGPERQVFENAMFGWGSRIWALPIWPDSQQLTESVGVEDAFIPCETSERDFHAGGLAFLQYGNRFEVGEVETVDVNGLGMKRALQQDWPVGSWVWPAYPAQLVAPPDLVRRTDTAYRFDIQMQLLAVSDWPVLQAGDLPEYRNHFVLDTPPDESADLTRSMGRLQTTLDNDTALPRRTDVANRAIPIIGWRDLLVGRQARAAWRSLLYTLRGRQVPVWVPTHADDLTLTAIVLDSSQTLDVVNAGYARFGQARAGRRDIRMTLSDGSVFYRRITGAEELDTDTERLSIDAPLGRQVAPADVARICWMTLCRLDTDAMEIDHITDSGGVARCAVVFRGVRDDEF